jgi:hypothetical protein
MIHKHGAFWDAIAEEQGREILDEAIGKLRAEGGATLTEPECKTLLEWIKEHSAKRKRKHGRPSDAIEIAIDCAMYEGFMPLKVAVGITAERYGVNRSTVYAARNKFSLSR